MRFLLDENEPVPPPLPTKPVPLYGRSWLVIPALIILFPAGLMLMWMASRWRRSAKIVVTVGFLGAFALFWIQDHPTPARPQPVQSAQLEPKHVSTPAPPDPSVITPEKKIEIYSMAQTFVERRLKAPRSAKFPWSSDEYVVHYQGDNTYSVRSWVDAQNSFGAMLRSVWVVNLKDLQDAQGTYQAVSVDIYGQ